MKDFEKNIKTGFYEKTEGDYLYQLTWQQYMAAGIFLKTRKGKEIATEWYRSLDFEERKKVKRIKLNEENDFWPDPDFS